MTEMMGKLEACLERLSSAVTAMEAAGAHWHESTEAQGGRVGRLLLQSTPIRVRQRATRRRASWA